MRNNQISSSVCLSRYGAALMLCIALAGLLPACNKFLDVPPKNRVAQSVLFKDEEGFKSALTGVYIGMDKPTNGGTYGLYTVDLSLGMLSALAYNYDNITTTNVGQGGAFYNILGFYAYSDAQVKAEITGIWGGMYSNIANINNILTQIDGKQNLFIRDNFFRVKGEAIALRALFHFDLLRLFGQPPLTGPEKKAIPYVTEFAVTPTPHISLNAAIDSCIQDLLRAKDLLALTDTSMVHQATHDPFTSYTQNHLNYWAVQGLLARAYLYKGDFENAARYASSVIGSNKFPLITSNVASINNAIRDRTFSQELLFAVYATNLKNYNIDLFDKSGGQPLRLLPAGKAALYTYGSGSANDYRYTSWFDNSQAGLDVPSKMFQDNNLPYLLQNIIPVIRVSELYYILAECANKQANIDGSTAMLNKVRQARGVYPLDPFGISYADSVSTEIMKEYQKEFSQEGQVWFYYKRLNKNLKQVTKTTATIPADVYVFPLPDKEKEYNN